MLLEDGVEGVKFCEAPPNGFEFSFHDNITGKFCFVLLLLAV